MQNTLRRPAGLGLAAFATWLLTAAAVNAGSPSQGTTAPDSPRSRTGSGPHVTVELLADHAVPARGLRLALKFSMAPGWHIYWQNPGDSGGPPTITWTLPPGLTAAPLEWPAPERIESGGLVNYGYHGSIVLPTPITLSSGTDIPTNLTVDAAVRWIACADSCIPGRANLQLRFPLSSRDAAYVGQWKTAIETALADVPDPAPATWLVSATASANAFVIDVITGTRESHAVFFPLEASQVNDSAPQAVVPLPTGVRLTLAKSSQLTTSPRVVRGVVTLNGGRSYTIEAPVR